MQNNSTVTLQCGQVVEFDVFEKKLNQRSAEDRRKRNEEFARQILARWSQGDAASGQPLFNAMLAKAITGPIATRGARGDTSTDPFGSA
jgi:hypothetical protein